MKALVDVARRGPSAARAAAAVPAIAAEDVEFTAVRAQGPGGQNVNKTSTCVQLVHVPTGLSVKCGKERSQLLNRYLARRILLDRIEALQTGIVAEEKRLAEKIRRQKRRRSRRAREKMLQGKHAQSEKKTLRAKISPSSESS